jgi:CBS domain-containing protein
MRARPRAVAPDDSLARAAALMESVGVREVAVVADGKVAGILARTDLEPHRGHYEWTSVRAAMTPDPVCVDPHMPASEVARLIVRRGFNAVPVTERGELRGMITRADVLRALTDRG